MVSSTDRAAKLPWTESIAGGDVELLFMPFLQHQMDVMNTEFPEVRDLPFEKSLSYQSSTRRPARIESWLWQSEHFRKIRATYIDAGVAAQVFNSVWYPNPKYDLPLLGIDFLSFGKKKVLCVLDFQPLLQDEDYLRKYCEPIAYIKQKYEGLAGSMSARFYDETQFFSKQLAFAKFDNAEPVETQLFPAFKEYLAEYVSLIKGAEPSDGPESVSTVRKLHGAYDQYSAERDPAVGLFSTYWGEEWAERFTHEFLFTDSVPLSKEENRR
jgi:15,16-dihydrobiliverdin:ferredoxin oxidoreductase